MKPLVWFLAVFLVVLLTGCGSDIDNLTISENDDQAQLAPASTESQVNYQILAEAARQVGQPSNNCKEWVRGVVLKGVGKDIPSTDSRLIYQWVPSSVVKVVWQVKFACVKSFSSSIKPGQIMQIKWRYPYMSGGPHTIILKSISATSITYYEANAGPVVKITTTSISRWQQITDAWTVYQVIP